MKRRYYTLDVFTREPLSGNPLCVVLDSDGLDDLKMQRIAAEFNLSETVFVLPPDDRDHRAKIRIFTPRHELPFAGHPTVGTAVLLATLDGHNQVEQLILEEKVGPVSCGVRRDAGTVLARFQMPKLPQETPWQFDPGLLADALSLDQSQLGFDSHDVAVWNGGLNYVLVPVKSIEAVRSISVDPVKLGMVSREFDGNLADVYAYCRGGVSHSADFHARMFAPEHGIPEDPATGSAVASLCGPLATLEMSANERRMFMIEQGFEMGRPSQVYLDITKQNDAVKEAGIEGGAVIVSEGTINL